MPDSIDRDAAIALFENHELTPDGGVDINDALDILRSLPSVEEKK